MKKIPPLGSKNVRTESMEVKRRGGECRCSVRSKSPVAIDPAVRFRDLRPRAHRLRNAGSGGCEADKRAFCCRKRTTADKHNLAMSIAARRVNHEPRAYSGAYRPK